MLDSFFREVKGHYHSIISAEVPQPPVDKPTFVTLAQLAVTNVILSTHDGPYKQTDGLAMGSQPAPYLANISLSKFEPTIKNDTKLFERYMDDILRSINRNRMEEKLAEINELHPNLKFTMEVENEGKLPFLDMCILHIGNTLASTWYCKPTDTGLIMNFHALAPTRYKRSVVEGFIHRIYRSCSSWVLFNESVIRAKEILEQNQYPPEFYDDIIKSTIDKIILKEKEGGAARNPKSNEDQLRKSTFAIQYRGSVTDNFIKQLKKSGAPIQPIVTLRKLKTTLPSLKPLVKKELRSGVIYKITCPGCNSCYVGQTRRHLITRFKEHKNKKDGAVKSHFWNCVKGKASLEHVEVIDTTTKGLDHLLTLEALYIRDLKPELNTKDEFKNKELIIKI